MAVRTTLNANVPKYMLTVNKEKAKSMSVDISLFMQ